MRATETLDSHSRNHQSPVSRQRASSPELQLPVASTPSSAAPDISSGKRSQLSFSLRELLFARSQLSNAAHFIVNWSKNKCQIQGRSVSIKIRSSAYGQMEKLKKNILPSSPGEFYSTLVEGNEFPCMLLA